jgi:CHAT domain-containing protein/Tfp pilus assembly protein PilF
MKWFILILLIPFSANSQDKWADAFVKGIGDSGSKKKAQLDSVDFQFAMSVNENASFFDIENKGEGWARGMYAMKERKDKTISEIARDSLEFAINLYNMRMFKLAETSLKGAQNFMETNNLNNDVSYMRCVSNLGLVYLIQSRTVDAQQLIDFSLESSQRVMGEKSAAYTANLNSKAKLNHITGKYNEAEKQFDEAEQLAIKVFGEASMQSAILLNNKAMLYQTMGRYPEAVELMKKSIAAAENAPKKLTKSGKNSFENRKFLSNLALLYQLSGKLTDAETTFLGIKKVFENRAQTNNPDYANLLNQLALLYEQMGKPELVEPLLTKAATVYKKKFTEENPSFAKVQNDLGTFYRTQGKFAEAEVALQKAVDIRKRTLGDMHPDYVKSIENLGILYWKKGELPKADPYFTEAMTKSLNFINDYFPPMSEAEKAKYWDVLQPRFQRYYNYALDASASNPSLLGNIFDYQIATKALLLNSTNKIKKSIIASGDQALIAEYVSWISQKETLARYYSLSKEDLVQQKIDLNALEKQANASERSLSQRSADFSQGYNAEQITYKQIASQLTDTEALVEIIRVRSFDKDFTNDAKYIALVLTKNSEPKMIVLDNGAQMETRFAKFYKNSILQKSEDAYSYDQYWSKLDNLLTGKKAIYLSPDGVYNQINVNTLKKPAGDYVLNKFDIVVIGNSKDLIAIKNRKPGAGKKDAFLLGFPDYGGAAVALPGTKIELENINKILKTAGYQSVVADQKNASETRLKAVKGPSLMHIATHGYFLADGDIGSSDAMGIDAENAKNNPLLRSGLILAGAPDPNKTETKSDLQSNDNGILTAYEAMNLNLDGTDLIVLSACETGLGDVKAGEGVYGLQRAFQVAGANALIMSLWKVDDEATQMLMTNFYTNWTKSGNKLKAFKQAQIQLMAKYKDPYYWGAFTMMGM